VDMSEASRWRAHYAEGSGVKASYTALLVKVVAQALREHPHLNAAWVDDELRVYREINVGVAVATAEGLLVPVVRRADGMSLSHIQETITQLQEKANKLRFAPDDLRGGTFTVSNLGMYGIDAFRAIINPPEAAILAVGRIVERPVGVEGQIVLRSVVRLTLSIDHRVVDGAQAASFIVAVRHYLENPYLLL
jgi:pyruvate dehydrogenase E2 component (dihydrolipoamide acetyltransferase)